MSYCKAPAINRHVPQKDILFDLLFIAQYYDTEHNS